ncbi:hypothetical protein GONAM_11_01770 [Gordonia namibiensis NBRC 108229]|uniref:Uncharacterized protein n=1 Tax=Gordonia namibiensis NBRC 108229 TaxID=1208314 RepID=K6X6H5_9ACTN|nr:hypothetical protein [Gordonia namibiensis]GAB99997.1 hypothetical protein GONAM_11_01770 [Gordonia namibiensis NBRC 108229]
MPLTHAAIAITADQRRAELPPIKSKNATTRAAATTTERVTVADGGSKTWGATKIATMRMAA